MSARTVIVTITVSETGRIVIDTAGPIDGWAGLVALLEAARVMAEQGMP